MKATTIRKKFDNINKAIANQIDKLCALADELEDIDIADMLNDYAEKLSDIVINDEGSGATAGAIFDYIDNELIPNESNYNEDTNEEG